MNATEYKQQHPGAQVMSLPVAFTDASGEVVMAIEEGAAESRDGHHCATIYLPYGDVSGFRNLQAGEKSDKPATLNFDYGAGSASDRGIAVSNWDIGRGFDDCDGRGNVILRGRGYDDPSKNFVEAMAPLRVHSLLVPKGTGWRRVTL